MEDVEGITFDAIIIGTGITQSILAGSLSRIGKKVLHLDENEYYGGELSTFQLNGLIDWSKDKEEERKELNVVDESLSLKVKEKCGVDVHIESIAPRNYKQYVVTSITDVTEEDAYLKAIGLKFELPLPPGSDIYHPAATSHTMELNPRWKICQTDESILHPVFYGYNVTKRVTAPLSPLRDLLSQSRNVNLDISPRLLFSQGVLVDQLVKSGVGQHLEFKPLEASFIYQSNKESSDYDADALKRVPCSKKEIFQNTFLPVKDKRILMKFLQFSMDYYINENILDVTWLNESSLQQGRSLKRPQNKTVIEYDIDSYSDKPFSQFLVHCGLSSLLQTLTFYPIALLVQDIANESDTISTREGMIRIGSYLNSLGRYGTSAFLVPMYGAADLTQSFARLSAVYGGIYMLQNTISHIVYTKDDVDSKQLYGIIDKEGRVIQSKLIICSDTDPIVTSFMPSTCYVVISRAIIIVDKPLLPSIDIGFLVIPPGTKGIHNKFAIQVLQMNSASHSVPYGYYVLYLSLLASKDDVNGVESTQCLSNVINMFLFNSYSLKLRNDSSKPSIIWKMTFNHFVKSSFMDIKTQSMKGIRTISSKNNIGSNNHVHIDLDDAATEAKEIFKQICPDKEFLPKNQTALDLEKAEAEEEVAIMTMNDIDKEMKDI